MMSLDNIARALGGEIRCGQVMAPGPGHRSIDRSLAVKLDSQAPDGFVVHSHAGDDPIECKDYVREKCGLPAFKLNGKAKTRVVAYDYTDEQGQLLFQVVRFEPKDFRQRRPDGNNGWIWSIGETRRVLYHLVEVAEAIAAERPIFIAEGEKAADALRGIGVTATCSPHGAGKWRREHAESLRGADVVILPDNDEPGEQHCEIVRGHLLGIAAKVRVLKLPDLPPKGDAFDWIEAGGTADRLWQLVEAVHPEEAKKPETHEARLRPFDIHDLFKLEIPERQMILDPIIPEKGLAMLYASRGIGKTYLACAISYAIATGTKFLKWEASKPRKVLHCDGEMPAAELRDRFEQLMAGGNVEPQPGMLNVLTADLIEMGIGNLASIKVQQEIDDLLNGIELLVLDNLSSLTTVIRDNEGESWNPIQGWLLRLRRRGVSVLLVHHAGKGGDQRGTSRREDVLDTSLSLRRPSDYQTPQGARFEVHFGKARGIYGDRAKPFEAQFEIRDGAALWTIREIEDVNLARVKALLDDGLTVREIADETGIARSTVGRLKKQIEATEALGRS
jgi:AAA domain-containing protein/helix-turn-helix resolvase-like protein